MVRVGWMLLPALGVLLGMGMAHRPSHSPATFPQVFEVEVSGHPALASTVANAVAGAIETKFVAVAGATWTYDSFSNAQLLSGASAVVPVNVRVTGPDGVRQEGTVSVKVVNKGEALGEESVLWFDNKPENILRQATLYTADLKAGNPVRLLYHHTCRSTQPMVMRAELRNTSDKPARVLVVPGDAKPNREPVLAGASSAAGYLPAWNTGSGEIIDIPPQTSRIVAFRRMVLGDVMSGLCSLRLLDNGPDQLQFVAFAEYREPMSRAWELALLSKTPYDEVGPQSISLADTPPPIFPPLRYLGPNVQDTVLVKVGDHSVTRDIGVEGIPQEGGGRALNGNYGVVYRYAVRAENPTAFPAKVILTLTSKTPYTSGVFLVDGRLVVLKPLKKGQTREVFRWTVQAGRERDISVVTVPVSGASYPNTLRFSTQLDG